MSKNMRKVQCMLRLGMAASMTVSRPTAMALVEVEHFRNQAALWAEQQSVGFIGFDLVPLLCLYEEEPGLSH